MSALPKQRRHIDSNIVEGSTTFSIPSASWVEAERLLGVPIGELERTSFIAIYQQYLREKHLEDAAVPLFAAYDALQQLSEMIGAADLANVEALRLFKAHLAHTCIEVDLAAPSGSDLLGIEHPPVNPRAAWITPSMLYQMIYHLRAAAAKASSEIRTKLADQDQTGSAPHRPFARGSGLERFIVDAIEWAYNSRLPSTASNSSLRPFPRFLFFMLGLAPSNLREVRLASVDALSSRILQIQRKRKRQKSSVK